MNIKRKLEILQDISKDMEKVFELNPTATVVEYFGKQGAAIADIANILKSILTEIKKYENE